ncbi:phosphoglycerate mutase [Bifidobacterium aemilianum]|uniref:Phosphoglycerate mutase n=1 Tax=Bifidobacterium aemilianum TaxID=2493120 RepID=A0A366KAI7_9BIFI|nr:histidine phosphatase family protein [Bifidobacterium aemilianum]RBP98158.1 phosphoglycerate mutase [Bifidobacterium aemilianum]
MIDQVIFLRHGRTSFNLQRRMQGQIDIPLDIVGLWQVDQSAYQLAQNHYWAKVSAVARNPELLAHPGAEANKDSDINEFLNAPAAQRKMTIVSSDLFRAQQTAHAFADLVGLPVHLDTRLRERAFGQWEGLTRQEIEAMDAQAYAAWKADLGEEPTYGVESKGATGRRGAEAVLDMLDQSSQSQESETLLLVGHGSWIVATIATLLGMDPDSRMDMGRMRNAFWSVMKPIHRLNGGLEWQLEAFNQGPAVASLVDWENGPADLHGPDMPEWIEL